MQKLSWDPSYIVGEPVIDKEHKRLFQIAQEAFHVVSPTERTAKVKQTLQKLYK
jgi:hemerythrin